MIYDSPNLKSILHPASGYFFRMQLPLEIKNVLCIGHWTIFWAEGQETEESGSSPLFSILENFLSTVHPKIYHPANEPIC